MALNDKIELNPQEKAIIQTETSRLQTSLTIYLRARVHEGLLESELSHFVLKGRILQGENSGAFRIGDKIVWTTLGLQNVLFIKQTYGVIDEQIEIAARILTDDGSYVNWVDVQSHFHELSQV